MNTLDGILSSGRNLGTCLFFVVLLGCDQKPKTDLEKSSYAYGVQMAQSIQSAGLQLDTAMVQQGLKDLFSGKELSLTQAEIQSALLSMSRQAEENRQLVGQKRLAGEKAFVEAYMKVKDVQRTPSGVLYRVIKKGEPGSAKPKTTVKLHYTGTLSDGKIFDSTYQRGEPSTLKIEALVPGWQEVLKLMSVGAKWEVVIPPDLAYGSHGNPLIPPHSALKLEMEVLAISDKTLKE